MADRGAGGGLSYRSAGVDLDAAERAKARLKELVASTRDENTLSELGSFGGLYAVPEGSRAPVLVASADGVGTKLKVAFLADRHDTVGRDLVNHCVNDILVQGARPLFFLDYLAVGVMDESRVTEVVAGVALGCRDNACALLGGETAQMPDFYAAGEYDLAGFIVGVVEKGRVLDGGAVRAGDALVAIGSTGLHTNGYTLARRIVFDRLGLGPDDPFPGTGNSVADELLAPHRSYLRPLLPLLEQGRVHALAHITGGGVPGNLPRVLPQGLGAVVRRGSWQPPAVFRSLQQAGGVETEEMDRVFNMGVGMIAIVPPADADAVVRALGAAGETAWALGVVERGEGVRYA
jgi:phosphoribosylformylglycinamidine cyclo-ligase